MEPRPALLLPAYNHAAALEVLLPRVLLFQIPVILVNDGSTDHTSTLLDRYPRLHRIDFKRNRGKGAALREGMKLARSLGCTHAITMDSDGQHDPENVEAFLKKIRLAPDSLVLGVRQLGSGWKPLKSRLCRFHSNVWVWLSTRCWTSDSQTGFRSYPLATLSALDLSAERYDFEVEILVKWLWSEGRVLHLPVRTFYPPHSASRFRLFEDSLLVMKLFCSLIRKRQAPRQVFEKMVTERTLIRAD